jgi:hypothetical protein
MQWAQLATCAAGELADQGKTCDGDVVWTTLRPQGELGAMPGPGKSAFSGTAVLETS